MRDHSQSARVRCAFSTRPAAHLTPLSGLPYSGQHTATPTVAPCSRQLHRLFNGRRPTMTAWRLATPLRQPSVRMRRLRSGHIGRPLSRATLVQPPYIIRRHYVSTVTAAVTALSHRFSCVRCLSTHSTDTSPSEQSAPSPSSLSSLLPPTRRRLLQRIRALLEDVPSALRGLNLSVDDRSLLRDTQQQLDQVFLLVVVGSATHNTAPAVDDYAVTSVC